MKLDKRVFSQSWFQFAILIVASAFVYLPRVADLSYYKDDWYYIYDAYIAGASVFREMFSIDRPARGLFFEVFYNLLGPNALPYHMSAFAWRILAVGAALWLFNMLWPKERRTALLMAALFALYPGYLWWVSAIEYQPMMASLALQVSSIALTIKGIQADKLHLRIFWTCAAILTGWAYIWLVDYAIGAEVLRFLFVWVFVSRTKEPVNILRSLLGSLKVWAIYVLIPVGFLVWRTLFFSGERKATDIGLQLGVFFADPDSTLLRWMVQLIQSIINVGLAAWILPFSTYFFGLRLRDVLSALFLAFVVSFIVLWTAGSISPGEKDQPSNDGRTLPVNFSKDALVLGCLGVIFGVLPVVLANRSVTFNLSHYALPASLAGVLLITGVIQAINTSSLRMTIFAALIALAVLTHFAVMTNAITEERLLQNFWWQTTWRVPAIRSETTLVIHYPSANIGDDGFGVMEAPNLIYFPQAALDAQGDVHYNLSALSPSDKTVQTILVGNVYRETGYRSHTVNFDYENILILSQPLTTSCVHVIDGNRPVLSAADPGNLLLIASKSNIENINTAAPAAVPQKFAFGLEPEHNWCYYFEKADLAIQQQDWELAAALGDEAISLKLTPEDQSEWMPFVEAYAVLGNEKMVKNLSTRIGIDDFVRIEACLTLQNNQLIHTSASSELQELISEKYCRNVNEDQRYWWE